MKLTLSYTARDGGDDARTAAIAARKERLRKEGRLVMYPLHAFLSSEWDRFTSENVAQHVLDITLKQDWLPEELRDAERATEAVFYFQTTQRPEAYSTACVRLASPGFENPIVSPTLQMEQIEASTQLRFGHRLRIELDGDSAIPEYGWIILRVKPRRR